MTMSVINGLQRSYSIKNTDKTQLIWIGTRQQLAKLTVTELQLTNSVVLFTDMAMDLGVVLDGQLSYQCLTRWPLSVARVSSRYVS